MKRLTPSLKKKWVEALCSGKYKQGFRRLRDESGGYCCLGVLGAVAGLPEMALWGKGLLPESFLSGLDHDAQNDLAELNDLEIPFEVIAGLIDEAL